jgi:hypothetical protein
MERPNKIDWFNGISIMNGSNLNVSMYAICHEDFNEDFYEKFQYSSSTFALDRKIPDEKK